MSRLAPAKPILSRAIEVAEDYPLQQFGQQHDDAAFDGKTACTHVICQYLALLWKGRLYTINEVNSLAGMPYRPTRNGVPRGMNNLEFQRFCDRVGIPMEVRFGLSFETVLRWSNNAPVFYGMEYESAPRKRGYRYMGRVATPPFALLNGATQLGSKVGRHAVALLGYRAVLSDATNQPIGYRAWRKEPNHGSPLRPEKPPYDVITTQQAKAEYLAYLQVSGATYCALPTKKLPL